MEIEKKSFASELLQSALRLKNLSLIERPSHPILTFNQTLRKSDIKFESGKKLAPIKYLCNNIIIMTSFWGQHFEVLVRKIGKKIFSMDFFSIVP